VRSRGLALLEALELHAPGARERADAVASYAFATAVELDLVRERCELIRETARLHDVGRIYLPAELSARPPAELLPHERELVDGNPEAGAALARGAGVPEEACGWILAARERYDGRGPDGLKGAELPLPARIIRAVRTYDEAAGRARANAPRRRGEPRALALSSLRDAAGTELDPDVVAALARVLERAAGAE
jgi:HD-GYP domain-containing protein (c-di-GMP phosphodiesterase class II)